MTVGLVLEGGGMRGMFTAGVLDTLMEQNIQIDKIIGISAGALFGNAMTFASAGKASAPGQIDVHELKRILDTLDVDGVFDEQQHKRIKVH